jgi:DNA-directed RNA polymerase subunit RPC12/RpoP
MPTQTQLKCPECGAKLRLADPPAADEEIECPKCGSVFTPSGSAPADAPTEPEPAPSPKKPKEKKTKGPRKRKAKVKKTNPYFLVALISGALVLLLALGGMFYWLFSKSGKVQEILSYVPAECNHARGINAGQIRKYPGYAAEVDKIITPDIKSAAKEMGTAAGMTDEEMSDYLVIGRSRKGGQTSAVYVFRASKDIDGGKLGTGLGGTAEQQDGQTVYRIGAKGSGSILDRAVVFPATKRVVVVVASGPRQAEMLKGTVAGKTAAKDDTFFGKVGATGAKVTSGNIWVLIRNTDDLKHYTGALGDPFAEAFKSISDEMAKTPVFGMWTSYGAGGIRFGLALQASTPEKAKELVKYMEDGPLGKKDDAEIPNGMKKGYSQSGQKEFREFLSNLAFRTSGDCAMITSKMSNEMGKSVAGQINGNQVGVAWDPRTDAYANKK